MPALESRVIAGWPLLRSLFKKLVPPALAVESAGLRIIVIASGAIATAKTANEIARFLAFDLIQSRRQIAR